MGHRLRFRLASGYVGWAEAAPQKARPAQRAEPLGSNITAPMFARQALYLRVQALTTHFRAVIFLQHTLRLAVFTTAEQHHAAWTTWRSIQSCSIAHRMNRIARKGHDLAIAPELVLPR